MRSSVVWFVCYAINFCLWDSIYTSSVKEYQVFRWSRRNWSPATGECCNVPSVWSNVENINPSIWVIVRNTTSEKNSTAYTNQLGQLPLFSVSRQNGLPAARAAISERGMLSRALVQELFLASNTSIHPSVRWHCFLQRRKQNFQTDRSYISSFQTQCIVRPTAPKMS